MQNLQEDDTLVVLRTLPDPDGVPVGRRIARTLKYALRACHLQCVHFEVVLAPPTVVVDSPKAEGPTKE
jgi:hypothetical protein